jgi:hypothetical protein
MTLHNLGRQAEAMELLLLALGGASSEPSIRRYERAISFYADKLDATWGE